MINVQLSTGSGVKHVLSLESPLAICELRDRIVHLTKWPLDEFYLVQNGRLAYERDVLYDDGYVTIVPRLLGGKGGFGSMLRAIGAQIEKTTNREACRDLSGRRLRDINEEKRLKAWIEKQAKREEEAADRKKKKLERLCAEPKHDFKDQTYERERSILTERVGDAVEAGFKATVSVAGVKRKHEEEQKRVARKKTILDLDIDSDDLNDSSDSQGSEEEEGVQGTSKAKLRSTDDQTLQDSGHSSEESGGSNKNARDVDKKDLDYPAAGRLIDEETLRSSKSKDKEQVASMDSAFPSVDLVITMKENTDGEQSAKETIMEC